MPQDPEQKPSFESLLEELKKVVEQLENEDIPLEESLNAFEKGVVLSKKCSEELARAESKVAELVGNARDGD